MAKTQRILNPKECFELWVELGSIQKVCGNLAFKGTINPYTQRPFTPMGVWKSAMFWVTSNIEEAWKFYQEGGSPFTKKEFEEWVVGKAMFVYGTSRKRFLRWIDENGFEKYEPIYERAFPRFETDDF